MAEAMVAIRQAANADDRHSYGALVGWKAEPGGQQLQLVMQTVDSPDALRAGQIDSLHMMLTQKQAVQLADFLLNVTGSSRSSSRRGPLARLLG